MFTDFFRIAITLYDNYYIDPKLSRFFLFILLGLSATSSESQDYVGIPKFDEGELSERLRLKDKKTKRMSKRLILFNKSSTLQIPN